MEARWWQDRNFRWSWPLVPSSVEGCSVPLTLPFFKIFFIGVQFANIQHKTQCSSRQVPPSLPITQSPQPPAHFPFHYPLFISQSQVSLMFWITMFRLKSRSNMQIFPTSNFCPWFIGLEYSPVSELWLSSLSLGLLPCPGPLQSPSVPRLHHPALSQHFVPFL